MIPPHLFSPVSIRFYVCNDHASDLDAEAAGSFDGMILHIVDSGKDNQEPNRTPRHPSTLERH